MTWQRIVAVVGVGCLLTLTLTALVGSATASGYVVAGAVVLLCLYDLVTYLVRGNQYTISVLMWELAKAHLEVALCVAFVLGVLVGHLFLPQHVQGAPVPTHLMRDEFPVGTAWHWKHPQYPGNAAHNKVVRVDHRQRFPYVVLAVNPYSGEWWYYNCSADRLRIELRQDGRIP